MKFYTSSRCVSILLGTLASLSLTGCAAIDVTKVDVHSFQMDKAGLAKDKAISILTAVFVDRGFDVKLSNTDAGIVTTEYKKFGSTRYSEVIVDSYLQVRAKLGSDAAGNLRITLTPVVRRQNRANAAASQDLELSYYTGDPEKVNQVASMRPSSGWQALGQTLFMNVVQDTSEKVGLRLEDVKQDITQTPSRALAGT